MNPFEKLVKLHWRKVQSIASFARTILVQAIQQTAEVHAINPNLFSVQPRSERRQLFPMCARHFFVVRCRERVS